MAKERHGLDGVIEKQCENCRYFAPYGTENGEGDCRRHAPAPINVRVRLREREDDDTARAEPWWPTVTDADWCGEFEPIDGSDW